MAQPTRLNSITAIAAAAGRTDLAADAGGWRWGALARYQRQDDGLLNTLSRTLRIGRSRIEATYDRNVYLNYRHATVTGSATTVPDALLRATAPRTPAPATPGPAATSTACRCPPAAGAWVGRQRRHHHCRRAPSLRAPDHALAGHRPAAGGASRLALRAEGGKRVIADWRARLPGKATCFAPVATPTVRGYGWRRIGMPVGQGLVGLGQLPALAASNGSAPSCRTAGPACWSTACSSTSAAWPTRSPAAPALGRGTDCA